MHSFRRHPNDEWAEYKNSYLKAYNFEWDGKLTDPRSNSTHIKYQHFENNPNFFHGVKIANVTVTGMHQKHSIIKLIKKIWNN